MKKYIGILLMSLFVASCAQQEMYYSDIDSTFYAEIEQPAPDDLTKTYYDTDSDKVLWDNGDLLTLFTGTSAPLQYKFVGGTGVTGGRLILSDNSGASSGDAISHNYAVYPYSEDNGLDGSEKIVIKTSGIQTYPGFDSFGENDNIMVAASDNTSFSFKNVCGWIILGLFGEGQVSSITLSGNNDEIIAGDLAITATVGGDPTVAPRIKGTKFTNLKEITLTCPDPVTLSSTATDFWIAVPPTVFSNGFSFTVTDPDGRTCTKSLAFSYEVQRAKYRRIATTIAYPAAVENIVFADETVKAICVENWDIDGDEELSFEEAAAITSLNNKFQSSEIQSFDELRFFTGLSKIEEGDFFTCRSLMSIVLPQTISAIEHDAFNACSSLTSITIPQGVTSIGDLAIGNCINLSSIIIPESVTSIGNSAFFSCRGLTSIIIPGGVTSIGNSVFSGCSSLTSITIPEGVTSIGSSAFWGCSSLTSITIPEGVTSIGSSAFLGCSSLTSITIPEGVTSVGNQVFEGCTNLTSISIPNGVTSIGSGAFSGCSSLTSITIPEGVTSIGSSAFWGCSSLTSITIPEGVTSIGSSAFLGCSSLTSITIPESVASIESYTFSGCRNMSSVSLPNSITSIGESAFMTCDVLASIIIPDSVTDIGQYAFYGCRSINTIIIPSSIASIGAHSLEWCDRLNSITINAITVPRRGASSFDKTYCPIYVPAESIEAYKVAWSYYADRIYAIQEINGHAYVDMGNGLKWATMNIGASSPDESGDYFAWGETTTKEDYNWPTYLYGGWDGSSIYLTKYVTDSSYGVVDDLTILELSDDAARQNLDWGSSWRVPTDDEWLWLLDNCTWTWGKNNNVYGYTVTSNIDGFTENSIFLPAAGYRLGTSLLNLGTSGMYWSSSVNLNDSKMSWGLFISSLEYDIYSNKNRCQGESIRPVSD